MIEYKEIRKVLNNFKKEKTKKEIFYNLCFCICAPQIQFKNNLKAINFLRNINFYEKNIKEMELFDIKSYIRFNRKIFYLLEMKENFSKILDIINEKGSEFEKRNKLAENVKGFGLKTASHFLRNLGIENLAIIDTHILKFLKENSPTSKNDYFRIENKFKLEAEKRELTMAELDCYIWKKYTGVSWTQFIY